MFIDEDEETMRRFYTDVINSAVFQTPLNYLHKYPHIQDYAIIAHSEAQVLRLLYLMVSRDLDRAAKMGQLLSEQGVDERVGVALAGAAANKYADIRRQLLRREICRGGSCLIDHNWRIVNVLSTNWTAGANRLLLGVTLVIMNQSEQRITLELDVHETERFLNRLKEIKRSLKV